MEQLGLFPQYLDQGGIVSPPFNTTLHQFENALANMTALVYWACIFIYFGILISMRSFSTASGKYTV